MELFTIIGVFALIPINIIANGLVLSVLWDWFVVEIFNLPRLDTASAVGYRWISNTTLSSHRIQ